MYIGVYGGTFNPVHFGHLRTAEEICERFKMREVLFIPSAKPPHKESKDIVGSIHRLKMVNLAVTGNRKFCVSEEEIHRRGKSYSIDTIRALKKKHPDDELAFILGMDAFLEIHTWHKYQEIFSECDFIVTTRPGSPKVKRSRAIPKDLRDSFRRKKSGREYLHDSGTRVIFSEVTHFNISATAVRDMVHYTLSIRYLLPIRVSEYIHEHKLYK